MRAYIVTHMQLLDLIDRAFDHYHDIIEGEASIAEAESEAARLAMDEFEGPSRYVTTATCMCSLEETRE